MSVLRCAAGIAFACGVLFPPAWGEDLIPHSSGKYKTARRVYDDIVRAIGDGRPPPAFEMRPTGTPGREKVAWFDPAGRRITLEERAYDLCTSMGADSLNGLAVLFGHELAHYYKDHNWSGDFGNAFADVEAGKIVGRVGVTIDEVTALETQADEFGGFFGYLAGYRTLDLAPQFLTAVYATFQLNPRLRGYPSLDDRRTIAVRSGEKLRSLIPLFEAANNLLILKQYDEAALLLDVVAQSFPSREILGNAGIARALAALELFDRRERRFAYPLEFDAKTRLRGARTRGPSDSNAVERRTRLLDEAREKFEEAARRDPEYPAALVGLACVYDLQGEGELATAFAAKAIAQAGKVGDETTGALGLIARGIAHANAGRREQALADFESARLHARWLASVNSAVLRPGEKSDGPPGKSGGGGKPLTPETIDGLVPKQTVKANLRSRSTCIPLFDCGAPEYSEGSVDVLVRVDLKESEKWEGMAIGFGKKRVIVVKTREGYDGKTRQGIRVGSGTADVERAYGNPDYVVPDQQGVFLIFRDSALIIHAGADSRVTHWMLFADE